jgi:hypothetical protein
MESPHFLPRLRYWYRRRNPWLRYWRNRRLWGNYRGLACSKLLRSLLIQQKNAGLEAHFIGSDLLTKPNSLISSISLPA